MADAKEGAAPAAPERKKIFELTITVSQDFARTCLQSITNMCQFLTQPVTDVSPFNREKPDTFGSDFKNYHKLGDKAKLIFVYGPADWRKQIDGNKELRNELLELNLCDIGSVQELIRKTFDFLSPDFMTAKALFDQRFSSPEFAAFCLAMIDELQKVDKEKPSLMNKYIIQAIQNRILSRAENFAGIGDYPFSIECPCKFGGVHNGAVTKDSSHSKVMASLQAFALLNPTVGVADNITVHNLMRMYETGLQQQTGTVQQVTGRYSSQNFTLMFPTKNHVIVFVRPQVHYMLMTNQNQDSAIPRLHRIDGPAVEYLDGTKLYFLNGVQVPNALFAKHPKQMTSDDIKGIMFNNDFMADGVTHFIANVEVRREIIKFLGMGVVLPALEPKYIDKAFGYELVEIDLSMRLDMSRRFGRTEPNTGKYLIMTNPSTKDIHVEGVSNDCNSVKDAIIFRNGLKDYEIDDVNGADYFQQGDVVITPAGVKKLKLLPKILT